MNHLLYYQCALLNRALTSCQRVALTTRSPLHMAAAASTNFQPCMNHQRFMHTSLHDASYLPQDFFSVTDDGYDAGKYGYRVVVSTTARRHSSTMTKLSGEDDYGEYSPMRNTMHLRNLDILASPEVLEILESQREWDNSLHCNESVVPLDDPYLSDCEEMHDKWEQCNDCGEEFNVGVVDTSPSLEEKTM